MLISEIFHSIQGEGELTGVPSIFIRTSGCNLRCRWCDTMYASWKAEGTEMSVGEIIAELEQFPSQHVVVTGGEPLVAKGIHELLTILREQGKHTTIETAATVPPEGITCDLASLSPKLANSTPQLGEIADGWIEKHESRRLQPEVIAQWIDQGAYQLKFVISSASDIEEIETLITSIGRKIPPEKVLLMPEGTDTKAIRSRDDSLIELCKQRGYRYCNRLHVELFGNTRGT